MRVIMENNIYIIDKTVMPTFRYMYTGSLIITPHSLYFIASGKVSNVKIGLMAGVGGAVAGVLTAREYRKAFDESISMESYLEQLDNLVQEKEGSLKIAKNDINTFKVPTGGLFSSIKVKTHEKKYEFNIANAIKEEKLPEIRQFLANNLYPL